MGLVILFAVGGILGWLSSIILAVNERGATVLYVGASILGAILVGLIAASGPLIEAISPQTVLSGCIGAIVFFAIAHALRRMAAD